MLPLVVHQNTKGRSTLPILVPAPGGVTGLLVIRDLQEDEDLGFLLAEIYFSYSSNPERGAVRVQHHMTPHRA